MGTAFLLLSAKSDHQPKIAAGVLMNQLLKTATAIRDYRHATRNLRQAQAVEEQVIRPLATLTLPKPGETFSSNDSERAPVSPLPNPLDPRPHIGAKTTPGGTRDARER